MVMPGKVTDSWSACLRSFCAAIRISAALLRSAAESMGVSSGSLLPAHPSRPAPSRGLLRMTGLMLQLGVDLEAGLRLLGDLVDRHAGRQLDQRHAAAFAVDVEDPEIGDHHIDN